MKKLLFLAAIAAMMTVGCTKEQTPASTNPGGQQNPGGEESGGDEEGGDEGGGDQKVLTGLRSAYTYYVADEALNISVVGKPKKVVAVYSDNTTESVDAASVFFAAEKQIAPQAGEQVIPAVYKGQNVNMTIPVKKGSEGFGATSLSTTEWAWASENTVGSIEVGQTATLKMFVYSSCKDNYFSPCVQLCNADWTSNFISVRMDNYGWDSSWDACTKDNNWNWGEGDTFPGFRPYQNHDLVTITVTRNTATTATIRYDVTYWNGEQHFQSYSNIAVSDMVNFRFFTENSYAVVYEISKPEGGGEQGGGEQGGGEQGGESGVDTDADYISAYSYYVYDEALDLSVVGAPKRLYANGGSQAIDGSAFSFASNAQIAATAGNQIFNATYQGQPVTVCIPVIKGTDKGGAKNFNTNDTNKFVDNTVGQLTAVGQSATTKMFVYSACGENWHAPVTDVCYGDWNGVFFHARMDNYGWWEKNGDIWEAGNTFNNNNRDIELNSNWDWDTFKGFQTHAAVAVTVTVASETTATVRYDVTYWNGEKHYQEFSNIGVGLPINWRFFTENSYAVVYE